MSQRGPAPYPSSRRSSTSPTRHEEGPPQQHVPLPGSSDVRPEPTLAAATERGSWSQPLPPRALGFHNMLNPSEPLLMASEGTAPPSSRPGEGEAASAASSARAYASGSRPFFPGHTRPGSHPGTPIGNLASFARPPSSGRNSPVTNYPFPPLNDPRQMVSPKLPRGLGLAQGVSPREAAPRPQPLARGSSPAKRPYETEALDESRPLPGLHHTQGRALAASHSLATPPRAMAQPAARPADAPYVPPPAALPPARPQSLHSHAPFQHGAALSRPSSAAGTGPAEGPSPWSEAIRRSGMGGAMAGAEGQQAFMALPGSDTPIPVQVDYSQASKKADEKRQRNAKASTRHRRKKKTMQEENMRQLQELKDDWQRMVDELEDLRRQRDFYRDDRNRLRDVVARTPGIHQHATSPPSPSARSTGSHAERSPGPQTQAPAHSQMATPTQGYASEPSSAERPAQRRRTDERAEFSSTAIFGTPAGAPAGGLASLSGSQAYGGPSRPLSAASSGSVERLPPLRAMEGPPPGPTGQPQEQDPRTGQWRPAQPRQYETGWATAPRKPHEGHPPPWQ